ncbi:hypothetical protein [Flavobacterium wongokense]|uniref:hypothetical protein n=1 Tax=Flavobacterium wongokense TaxID=2910674 RepID=UPI001F25CC3D|nr:hypothetical protein [Flavobacterium sp. WG47]MCF6131109.1 hypothetical protein [Flavobacterium sp. WG47]
MEPQQTQSILNYKRNGISIVEVEVDTILVKQESLVIGYILNQKQLVRIGKHIFPKSKVKPVAYSLNLDTITIEWINDKIKELGIKTNDLIKQLAIDKATLSLILNSKKELPKIVKPLFYYYFLSYEINKDFRKFSL